MVLAAAGILSITSCQFRETTSPLDGAAWITDNEPLPSSDSLYYQDQPAPLLRTSFSVPGRIRKAELHITAAGYYETWINGRPVGDQQLDPAWTDYSKRVYVTTIDVTDQIIKGENVWGIMPGNGFYNPLPLRMWGGRNIRTSMPVGKPAVMASMRITLRSGREVRVATSGGWRYTGGPVIRNSVYLGEWFDARKEIMDWCLPGTDLSAWNPVKEVDGPGGKLIEADFPPIRVTKWIDPIAIRRDSINRAVVDFGQNLAGVARIRIRAEKGDTIRFRYGERIYADGSINPMTAVCGQIKRPGVGGPGAPSVAEQIDVYIARGVDPEFFQPRFTFHGFRYMEISGLDYIPVKEEIQAGRMNTDVKSSGGIQSSSQYLNKLNDLCQWTFLSNLFSVQSDCPAREKFGYGGDINATAEAYIYNFDMKEVYRKVIYDWVDAMKPDGFIDTAPFVGIEYCGISWESAFLFLQDWLLIHYQDTELIHDLYNIDREWMEKVARIHPGLLVDNGLSDHESLQKVPVELTGTCHYLQAARTMERFARLLGREEDADIYAGLAGRIRAILVDRFWDEPDIEVQNKQTLLASLLYFGVLTPDQEKIAMDRLLEAIQQNDYHVTTGIFGTKYLLDALSSNGRTDIACKMVTQSGFPGWKHMVDQGATTLWETWKESDNTFSQNHPMFGSVSEWYHKWLGGIQPDPEKPASGIILLQPRPVRDLGSLTAEKTIFGGTIRSKWWWEGEKLHLEFDVPPGKEAEWVPESEKSGIEVVDHPKGWNNKELAGEGRVRLYKSGKYHFII